jgi:3-methyladenine DNA glycosylase AlkD
MKLVNLQNELRNKGDPKRAKLLAGYFKTGKGEYGEGDIFLGLTVPQLRDLAKKYRVLNLSEIKKLLQEKIHECRLTALLILVAKYKKADEKEKKKIADFYLEQTKFVNNWDLVDLSCHEILGDYFLRNPKEKKILIKFAKSKNLWERRIAIITTAAFIDKKKFDDSLQIAGILVHDKEDLIHKAVGWMLREIGKRDRKTEEVFLQKYYKIMPRTMLRYGIEKFPESLRKKYLLGKV